MQLEFFQSKEYQLLREIGRGGMASVYEAIETSISRRVAIKILPPSAGLDDRQTERFRAEANITAGLDHPHIVRVFSVGREHDTHFYTMKLVAMKPYIDGDGATDILTKIAYAAPSHANRVNPAVPPFSMRSSTAQRLAIPRHDMRLLTS